MRRHSMRTYAALALLGACIILTRSSFAAAQQRFQPDAEGFIRNWLVLAPVPLGEDSGVDEIHRDLIGNEAGRTPKPGDRIGVGGTELTWTPHQASDYYIDFLASFGQDKRDFVAAYAVAYVYAPEPMAVTVAIGTNDQGKAWLNGEELFVFADARSLAKDSDRRDVTLVRGRNVLILKVINESNNWQGCARFLKDGAPVTDLRIAQAPE